VKSRLRRWRDALASMELTLAALGLLTVLVVFCTLDQVNLGTHGAVNKYFRSFLLYAVIPGTGWAIPVFPAGGFTGLLLVVNLVSALAYRIPLRWSKAGLWFIHVGLILLVAGEVVTGAFSRETHMSLDEGGTSNFSESLHEDELVIVDRSDPAADQVFSIPAAALADGKELRDPAWPFSLRVKAAFPSAEAGPRPLGESLPPSLADQGLGAGLILRPAPEGTNEASQPAAFVEVEAAGARLGTWLLWSGLAAEQGFSVAGKPYSMVLRKRRRYYPFSLTLKDFTHEVYPGTEIPKNFSSLVRLANPGSGEERDVLIYMNHPLRYMGQTFYQASYGKGDTLSILQVVQNPGWLLPYISFLLVCAGLGVHFVLELLKFKPAAAQSAEEGR